MKLTAVSSRGIVVEIECLPGESEADCFRRHIHPTPPPPPHIPFNASSEPAAPGRRGPGWHLKQILRKVGIVATPNCSCNARAAEMDKQERESPGWCEANLETIVGWLREEAAKRHLPFIDGVGKMLVRRAITNARKERAGDEAKEGQQGGSAV